MDIPLIHKFEAGYRAGVKYVCPDCTVIAQYAGVTPEAFRNPGRGKELALSQYQSGVNVIFHASGSTGLGVFEAARQTDKLAIGVDADQYAEAPGHVLTSMVKGVDAVVFDQIEKARRGTFRAECRSTGSPRTASATFTMRTTAPSSRTACTRASRRFARGSLRGAFVVPATR